MRERVDRVRDGLSDRRRLRRTGDDLVTVVHRLKVHGASRLSPSGAQIGSPCDEKRSTVSQSGNFKTFVLSQSSQWTTASFDFHQRAVHKRTTMLAHCNLKQNTWLCSKQSSFFSFYALHWWQIERRGGPLGKCKIKLPSFQLIMS